MGGNNERVWPSRKNSKNKKIKIAKKSSGKNFTAEKFWRIFGLMKKFLEKYCGAKICGKNFGARIFRKKLENFEIILKN